MNPIHSCMSSPDERSHEIFELSLMVDRAGQSGVVKLLTNGEKVILFNVFGL